MIAYRVPFSTNVERVALALAHKGLAVRWVDVDPLDRSVVEEVSGQPLVPVLVNEGAVIADSTAILRYLEEQVPVPRLWPEGSARRAELDVFLDWFNRVWKRPPNELEAERRKDEPDEVRIAELGCELTCSLDLFERLLTGRDYLFGEFGAADCAAFPFLKYVLIFDEGDTEEFHLILREFLELGGMYPGVEAWIRRVDEHPRAYGLRGGRLPELEAISLGVGRPSEPPELAVLDLLLDRDPGLAKLRQHRVQIGHAVVDHRLLSRWAEVVGIALEDRPDSHAALERGAAPVLDVDTEMLPIPTAEGLRVARTKEDSADAGSAFHGWQVMPSLSCGHAEGRSSAPLRSKLGSN